MASFPSILHTLSGAQCIYKFNHIIHFNYTIMVTDRIIMIESFCVDIKDNSIVQLPWNSYPQDDNHNIEWWHICIFHPMNYVGEDPLEVHYKGWLASMVSILQGILHTPVWALRWHKDFRTHKYSLSNIWT